MKKRNKFRKIKKIFLIVFLFQAFNLPLLKAQEIEKIPSLLSLSRPFQPVIMKGIRIFEDQPFLLDFIIGVGDQATEEIKPASKKLISYFLSALTIPEDDIWVNLSPHEANRIIAKNLGQTEMGLELLSQDYLLKKLTASLMHPEGDIGEEFWSEIYDKVYQQYGTVDIPVDTFNKVWIVPDKIEIYQNQSTAGIKKSTLKVMLEKDYLTLKHNSGLLIENQKIVNKGMGEISNLSSEIIRQIIIPVLEREVNTGKHFASLRQIFNALILSSWFKTTLKRNIINKIYANQNKLGGVALSDTTKALTIYDKYLKTYTEGIYNFVKEEYDPFSGDVIPRKYFSGGITYKNGNQKIHSDYSSAAKIDSLFEAQSDQEVRIEMEPNIDFAMISSDSNERLNNFLMHPDMVTEFRLDENQNFIPYNIRAKEEGLFLAHRSSDNGLNDKVKTIFEKIAEYISQIKKREFPLRDVIVEWDENDDDMWEMWEDTLLRAIDGLKPTIVKQQSFFPDVNEDGVPQLFMPSKGFKHFKRRAWIGEKTLEELDIDSLAKIVLAQGLRESLGEEFIKPSFIDEMTSKINELMIKFVGKGINPVESGVEESVETLLQYNKDFLKELDVPNVSEDKITDIKPPFYVGAGTQKKAFGVEVETLEGFKYLGLRIIMNNIDAAEEELKRLKEYKVISDMAIMIPHLIKTDDPRLDPRVRKKFKEHGIEGFSWGEFIPVDNDSIINNLFKIRYLDPDLSPSRNMSDFLTSVFPFYFPGQIITSTRVWYTTAMKLDENTDNELLGDAMYDQKPENYAIRLLPELANNSNIEAVTIIDAGLFEKLTLKEFITTIISYTLELYPEHPVLYWNNKYAIRRDSRRIRMLEGIKNGFLKAFIYYDGHVNNKKMIKFQRTIEKTIQELEETIDHYQDYEKKYYQFVINILKEDILPEAEEYKEIIQSNNAGILKEYTDHKDQAIVTDDVGGIDFSSELMNIGLSGNDISFGSLKKNELNPWYLEGLNFEIIHINPFTSNTAGSH